MGYELEKKSEILYTVKLTESGEELQREIDEICKEIKKTAKVPGFRPGKAPVNLIKRYFPETIKEAIIERFLSRKIRDLIEKENMKVLGSPGIRDLSLDVEKGNLTATIFIEVKPEIDIKPEDYRGIKVKKTSRTITDEDVNKVIEGLRNQAVKWIETSEPAQEGNLVELDCEIEVQGEEPKKDRIGIVLGQKRMKELEDAVIGKKKGEEGSAVFKDQNGKEVKVRFRVESVKRKELPEVNDEFARRFGFENVEDMRKKIREDLEIAEKTKEQEEVEDQIVNELLKKVNVPVPPTMLGMEIRAQAEIQMHNFARFGIDPTRVSPETVVEMVRPVAEKTVKVKLLLEKVAELEGIEVTEEDIDEEIQKLADTAFDGDYVRARKSIEEKGLMDMIRLDVLRQKALDRLIELAEVEESQEEKS